MTDKLILSTEQDYKKVQSELNARKKPSKTLRYMMQALESYRQAKKMGWSRPWNKYNLVNFQTFKLTENDKGLRELAMKVISAEAPHMPEAAVKFAKELLTGDLHPMGFLFYHEFTDQNRRFEGVVVSYGRVNREQKQYRDRLDLILESEVIDGYSQGLSRLRLYVDPYLGVKSPLWQHTIEHPSNPDTEMLFQQLAGLSWTWANDQSRVWNHWVNDYIDYFGPRQWHMKKSFFHVTDGQDNRVGASNTETDKSKAA